MLFLPNKREETVVVRIFRKLCRSLRLIEELLPFVDSMKRTSVSVKYQDIYIYLLVESDYAIFLRKYYVKVFSKICCSTLH